MDEKDIREKSRQMKKFYRKIAVAALIFIAVALFVILIINQIRILSINKTKTEIAYNITRETCIEADGYAFRNETVIPSEASGVCTYAVDDGGRVSKGSTVVNVYANAEQASRVEQIEELTATVKALKELQTANLNTGADPDLLNKQIDETMFELLYDLNTGDISDLDGLKQSLVYTMSKYNIVTGNETNYNEKIKAVEEKIESLKSGISSAATAVSAPKAGYYISTVDGYENVLKASDVSALTVEQFESAVSQKETITSSAGKIVSDYDWYLVTTVEGKDVERMSKKIGQTVKVVLPYTSEGEFKASVMRVGETPSGEKAVIVLKCGNMSKTLASFRHQKVKIVADTYTGLSVNPRAIKTETGKGYDAETNRKAREEAEKNGEEPPKDDIFVDMQFRYVYINTGGVARKRYVEVMYEDLETETAVCRVTDENFEYEKRTEKGDRRKFLDIYDEVIVEGADLKDGKIV